MKLKLLFTINLLILTLVIGVNAQVNKVDYSGVWKLDVSKSEIDEKSPIKDIIMTVSQNDSEISMKRKVETLNDYGDSNTQTISVKTKKKKAGETYKLDGTETTSKLEGDAKGDLIFRSKYEKNNLVLIKTMNLNFQGNAINTVFTETWKLSKDGKTLKIKRLNESLSGTFVSNLVFNKSSKKAK